MTTRARSAVPAAILAGTLLLLLPDTAAVAAADETAGSLCDTISVEELEGLTGLAYEPALSEPWICNYVSPAGAGFDTILLAMDATGVDDVEGQRYPGSVEVTVAGASGVANSDDGDVFLVLDAGEHGTLRVNVDAGSAEAAGSDGLALAQAIAEIVIPNLGATAAAAPGSGTPASSTDGSALAPPAEIAAALDLRESISASGEAVFEGRSEDEVAVFAAMLDTLGAQRERLSIYAASAGSGDSYLAVRVADAPEGAVQPALMDAIGLSGALEGWTSEVASVGGKDVTRMTSQASPDRPVHVYADGDVVYLVQLLPEDAAALLESLP